MDILTAIEYVAVGLVGIYSIGLLLVWLYEIRKNSLYTQMQNKLRLLEDLHLSAALRYAKKYKIKEDYRKEIGGLERVQRFIFENVLFMSKNESLKKKAFRV